MKFIPSFTSLLIYLLIGCQSENTKVREVTATVKQVRYANAFKTSPFILHALNAMSIDGKPYMSYIDHDTLSLKLIPIEGTGDSLTTIFLNDSVFNINVFGEISSTSLEDSLLAFFQTHRVGIYNINTKTLINTFAIPGDDSLAFVDYNIPIKINSSENSIYVHAINYRERVKKKYDFDTELYYKLNYNTGKGEYLPVKYPASWGNGDYGMSASVSVCHANNNIIYSFSTENEIFVYNKSTKEVKTVNAESKQFKAPVKLGVSDKFDADKNQELYTTNFMYGEIIFNPYNNEYYRFYYKDQSLLNENDFFNSSSDKKTGVVILDSSLQVIDELQLLKSGSDPFGSFNKGFFYLTTPEVRKDSSTHSSIAHVKI